MAEDEMVWSVTHSRDMNLIKLQEIVEDRKAYRATVHELSKSRTQFSDSTTTNRFKLKTLFDPSIFSPLC